MSWTFRFAKHI